MSKNTVKPALTPRRRTATRQGRGRMLAVLLVRFVSGRPLDGRRHGNGTFWQPGTRRVGRPAYLVTWQWWALAAGWQRAGTRLSAAATAVMVLAAVVAR